MSDYVRHFIILSCTLLHVLNGHTVRPVFTYHRKCITRDQAGHQADQAHPTLSAPKQPRCADAFHESVAATCKNRIVEILAERPIHPSHNLTTSYFEKATLQEKIFPQQSFSRIVTAARRHLSTSAYINQESDHHRVTHSFHLHPPS